MGLTLLVRRLEGLSLCSAWPFCFSDMFLAPAEARVDNATSHDVDNAKHGLPKLRRDGCADILGFDCGSAPKSDTGPVGKLVKWMRLI